MKAEQLKKITESNVIKDRQKIITALVAHKYESHELESLRVVITTLDNQLTSLQSELEEKNKLIDDLAVKNDQQQQIIEKIDIDYQSLQSQLEQVKSERDELREVCYLGHEHLKLISPGYRSGTNNIYIAMDKALNQSEVG